MGETTQQHQSAHLRLQATTSNPFFDHPIPKPKKRKKAAQQGEMLFDEGVFANFTKVYQIESDFKAKVDANFNKLIEGLAT